MNLFNFFKSSSPAHNEIAENGADKVLSSEEENPSVHKTYVNFPTSRKSALDVPLCAISSGRSMVEMLGVLAIIGVLSVGAIAGYSKAMMKYKLNKQTEQLSTLINAVIRYQSDLRVTVSETSHGVEPIISYLRKLNEIPVEMLYPPNDRKYDKYIKDALNNDINIFHHNTNYIGLGISLQDNNISKETCKNVYLLAKNFSGDLGFVETTLESEGSTQYSGHVYGDRFCTGNRLCFKNLKVTDIDDLCSACTGDAKNCSLLFVWYD